MYQMLPGLITGLTRSLALAERADLQIDRLQGITLPPPAPQPPTLKTPTKQPSQEALKPLPTREEINRAVQAERDAEDAIAASVFTERQLNIFRALACLPEKLPDGPADTWNIKFDPNAPISAWRLAVYPHLRHRADRYVPADAPAPTTAGTRGTPSSNSGNTSGKHSGNASGKKIGNVSGNPNTQSASPQPTNGPVKNPSDDSSNKIGNTGKRSGSSAHTDPPERQLVAPTRSMIHSAHQQAEYVKRG